MDDATRFWAKVETPPDDGACWTWSARRGDHGYGEFGYHGRKQRAHRVAWELTRGPIPLGLCVLHRCDNPPCVRPDHLFLGTQADNVRDCEAKGRRVPPPGGGRSPGRKEIRQPGESNPQAKLTWELVDEIRAAAARGVSPSTLVQSYGIGRTQVYNIVTERQWRRTPSDEE